MADPPAHRLVDNFNRHLNYLRLSIIDRCNLRCIYCMPGGGVPKLSHHQVLTLEEIGRVARVAVGLGVDKIRLTGGEPLLRRNLEALLAQMTALTPRPQLRITTNGYFLADKLQALAAHGVSTVNVSLDTLDPAKFGSIAGLGVSEGEQAHRRIWRGIESALESGLVTVKLNVVLMRGINDDELADFARLTLDRPLAVRFIEYMPVGRYTCYQQEMFLSSQEALDRLEGLPPLSKLERRREDGPAQRLKLAGAVGELGCISAVSSHFCATCNRLRLSADGRLVPCLFSNLDYDLMGLLRGGCTDQELAEGILEGARLKPARHGQAVEHLVAAGRPMSRLGG